MVQKSSICIVFSGKRKSGKDYTVNHLTNLLQCSHLSYLVVRISEPIKSYFAEHYGLNLTELLSSNEYKENYRKQMINWMEKEIKQDPYIFVRKSLLESTRRYGICQPAVIIISDARRINDVEYLIKTFGRSKCLLIRIVAPIEIRTERGWTYVNGVDNAASECGLDEFTNWDYIVSNNGDKNVFENHLHVIVAHVKRMLRLS
ncbi:hypothetical protein MN116_002752 [Schistosoma mekongi]|uniref:Phosphomevalonate kinase n=1 Tax=Schistosoma mekongi TaxID=38744 RepID=A0AAE1ZFV6_SCHME|nr:hypothetical protein MN116_002752 [Schistosoma mekongi]